MAQTKFHVRYFSMDNKSGITIHIQSIEEAGCVRMDNCGWAIRWSPPDKLNTKWDQAKFDVAYLEDGKIKHDVRLVLGSHKSIGSTAFPVFVEPLALVSYIRVVLSGKGKELASAEFQ